MNTCFSAKGDAGDLVKISSFQPSGMAALKFFEQASFGQAVEIPVVEGERALQSV